MNRKFIVLPKVKRRTLKDQDVWLRIPEESKICGKMTVPCNPDEIMKKLFDGRVTLWTITFGHKEESK